LKVDRGAAELAPAGKREFGVLLPERQACYATSCFRARSRRARGNSSGTTGSANSGKLIGSKAAALSIESSTFVGGSRGYDGYCSCLAVDGKMYIQTGIGNLGTENLSDAQRVAAEIVGVPLGKVVLTWGNTTKQPWRLSGGSQTTAAITQWLTRLAWTLCRFAGEIAAKTLAGGALLRTTKWAMASASYQASGGASTTLGLQQAIKLGGKYDEVLQTAGGR